MVNAIDVPFDASKYAFRTNFDGLTVKNEADSARLQGAKKNYEDALTRFESQDKDARESYKEEKDNGFTNDSFGNWVGQNSLLWVTAKGELQSHGATLTQTAMHVFGADYQQKLENDRSDFIMAAHQAGHYPEFI